jgi:hypothetical protein
MFHAINARLARLARRTWSRLAIPFEYGIWHVRQIRQDGPETWRFWDSRFGPPTATCTTFTGGTPTPRAWAQDALAGRIRMLGPALQDPGKSPIYHRVLADLDEYDQIAVIDGKNAWRWP